MPLLRKEVHYAIPGVETCHLMHGFYDLEQKTCTTVHQLSKVCFKIVYDNDEASWSIAYLKEYLKTFTSAEHSQNR